MVAGISSATSVKTRNALLVSQFALHKWAASYLQSFFLLGGITIPHQEFCGLSHHLLSFLVPIHGSLPRHQTAETLHGLDLCCAPEIYLNSTTIETGSFVNAYLECGRTTYVQKKKMGTEERTEKNLMISSYFK